MKKWYVITGILALLWVTSLGTCSSNSAKVDELWGLKVELDAAKVELDTAKAELDTAKAELAQLKATKEINFGNGLKVFGVEKDGARVRGKVQNISNEPMQKVMIMVVFYNKDGQLSKEGDYTVRDLFVGEVAEWQVYAEYWSYDEWGSFDVYAIGGRK